MSLDNLEGIREWRDQLEETEADLIGIKPVTLTAVLTLMFAEITRLQMQIETGRVYPGGVETVPLGKRRRVASELRNAVAINVHGPDLL